MCDQEVGGRGFVHADCSACCWRSGGRSRCSRWWLLPVIREKIKLDRKVRSALKAPQNQTNKKRKNDKGKKCRNNKNSPRLELLKYSETFNSLIAGAKELSVHWSKHWIITNVYNEFTEKKYRSSQYTRVRLVRLKVCIIVHVNRYKRLAYWYSLLVRHINEVTLLRARLVPRWLTVWKIPPWYLIKSPSPTLIIRVKFETFCRQTSRQTDTKNNDLILRRA